MPVPLIFIPFIALSAIAAIVGDNTNLRKLYVIVKPITTIIIIVLSISALFLNKDANNTYIILITVGLVFSLFGDIFLISKDNEKLFLYGLISFLLAHIIYSLTFTYFSAIKQADIAPAIIILALTAGTYIFLYKGLGKMKIAVLVYCLVIAFMLWRATSTLFDKGFSQTKALLLFTGAISFFISDLILATNKFKMKIPYFSVFNLITYWGAQTLIALSIYY